MKNKILMIVLIITLLFSFSVNSFASIDEVERTIEYINDIRDSLGIPSLESNSKLKDLALDHNKYMYYNHTFSSIEESGNLYYRGRYPWDRASYFLYQKQFVKELLNNNNSTYTDGIIDFINNPYSRINILDPLYEDIGMSTFEGLYTYELGGEERNKNYTIIYPYNNQINVPINWENNYSVDPYEYLDVESTACGMPITYTYYSDTYKIDYFDDINITITNQVTDKNIKFEVLTPSNDRYLNNSIIILPLEKYDYNTTYEVKLNMDIYFTNYRLLTVNKTFSFQTEDAEKVSQTSESFLTRAEFTEELIKASKYTILEPFEIKFHDIDIKSVRAKYIYTAYVNNIIKGISDNLFGPDLNITKEQAYVMLMRAYIDQYGDVTYVNKSPINDFNKVSSYAGDSICKAYVLGLLITDKNNNLLPSDYLTENEFYEILERYNEIIDNL
jgi:hypothetical protein